MPTPITTPGSVLRKKEISLNEVEPSSEPQEEIPRTKQIYLLKHCHEPKDKDSSLIILHEALLHTKNIHSWIEVGLFKTLCHILTSDVVSRETFQILEKVFLLFFFF